MITSYPLDYAPLDMNCRIILTDSKLDFELLRRLELTDGILYGSIGIGSPSGAKNIFANLELNEPWLFIIKSAGGDCKITFGESHEQHLLSPFSIGAFFSKNIKLTIGFNTPNSVLSLVAFQQDRLVEYLGNRQAEKMLSEIFCGSQHKGLSVMPMICANTLFCETPVARCANAPLCRYVAALRIILRLSEISIRSDNDAPIVLQIKQLIDSQPLLYNAKQLSIMFGIPLRKISDEFKKCYGITLSKYLQISYLEVAFDLVSRTQRPLKDISFVLGYRHVNNFSNAFKKQFGYAPSRLRSDPHAMTKEGQQ